MLKSLASSKNVSNKDSRSWNTKYKIQGEKQKKRNIKLLQEYKIRNTKNKETCTLVDNLQ